MAELVIEQFSVCELRGQSSRRWVLVLQSHLLDGLDTVLVALMIQAPEALPQGLSVRVEIDGETWQVALSQLASLPRQALGRSVASLLHHEYEIRRAVDRLTSGF